MLRRAVLAVGLLLAGTVLRADTFDNYTNPILAKAIAGNGVKEVKQLTPELICEHNDVIPEASATLVIVRTNEDRLAKFLMQTAYRQVDDVLVPVLVMDRFATFKDGTERTVQATGQNVQLYENFLFSADIGQVVPQRLGPDLRFVVKDKGEGQFDSYLEPVGKARIFLVTKAVPEATKKEPGKVEIGKTFEPRYFNGKYKLYDDGRRSGTLVLTVGDEEEVTGFYYSDKDGEKYEVLGKVGLPKHSINFTIKFPRTDQTFQGWLFTGNGKAITGSSKMQERESGFYAERVE